ncbi:hypothetical protein BH23GEM7_BH23GEM7_27460 [soil metagenome]|nr:HEAT repeat domain-containing protein [Gemmatimonadota bacterium]
MSLWMIFDPVWSPEWLWLRYATLLRATLILLLAAGAATLLRGASASARAMLWAAALIALLPLPELRALPLHWSAHVIPSALAAPMVTIGATMVAQSSPAASTFPWTSVIGVVWLLGIALLAGRLLWGWLSFSAVAACARPVRDPAWEALLEESRLILRIQRRVRLLRTDAVPVPLTWGTLRPSILLPAMADAWPEAHRRAVLLHELAHVRRLDCFLALLGHAACALWWFHPGAWWAAHRLEVERERACDERVLRAGIRPSDYAKCLLDIADEARRMPATGPAVVAAGLLRRPSLGERTRAILDAPTAPRPGYGRIGPALVFAAAVAAVLIVGSMRIAPRPQVWWATLQSDDWTKRAYAVENIARFGDPASVAALESVLTHEPDPYVRAMAAFGERLRARSPTPYVRFGWGPGVEPAAPAALEPPSRF